MLGVNGVSLVMHGRSKAREFAGAIDMAKKTVQTGLVGQINSELVKMKGKINAG